MSFTSSIKNEIINKFYTKGENLAELSAILNVEVKIYENRFIIFTENIGVSRRIYILLKDLYQIDIKIEKEKINRLGKKHLIKLEVKEKSNFILKDLSILNEQGKRNFIPHDNIIDTLSKKQAYLRGIYIICGSINDPKTARYHAEFSIKKYKTANFVTKLLNSLNYKAKILKRENTYMVYIKEAENISDFIKLLNAYNSLFYYEDIRIYRDHKNMTNRLNNCEQANIEKVINTSNIQLDNIKKLKEKIDFDLLDDKLKEICIYKEKYPESSMQELADIISKKTGNKITKSGINHRFRKIKEMIK